ncbi:hypothetical protein [Halobacterium yunchengense]|uniref:hypothetical protein n=1 Tax=Halobacterium yunchengense TaxID=3108497 RepID=UPI00300823DA
MSELHPEDVAPRWVWLATAASAVLAVAAHLAGGVAAAAVAPLAGVTAVGVTALLYGWGQVRDEYDDGEGGDDGDGTDRRERELEAEAGGYGGSQGGG